MVTIDEVNFEGTETAILVITSVEILGLPESIVVKVYPNPSHLFVMIESVQGIKAHIYDQEGVLQKAMSTNKQVDIPNRCIHRKNI